MKALIILALALSALAIIGGILINPFMWLILVLPALIVLYILAVRTP